MIPAAEFFTGVFETALGPDEVLVEARPEARRLDGLGVPEGEPSGPGLGDGRVAALVHRDNGSIAGASIGLVNMGGTPLRARAAEDARRRRLDRRRRLARDRGREPPSDHAGSSEYRAHLARVVAQRALEQALAD